MDFQIQSLIPKQDVSQKLAKKENESLDLFVGIIAPLSSPFNLYFRVDDIIGRGDLSPLSINLVYFYGYSLGKDRIIMWGLYDETTNKFLIDNACKWKTQLNEVLKSLKERKV